MASGPEMMLKAMGIDLKQIDLIIAQMISGIAAVNAKLENIEKELAEIKARLLVPPAPTRLHNPLLTLGDFDDTE